MEWIKCSERMPEPNEYGDGFYVSSMRLKQTPAVKKCHTTVTTGSMMMKTNGITMQRMK